MKKLLLLLTLFIVSALHAQSPLKIVEENGSRGKRLNLVFLSEGYTSAEMGKFATDVNDAVNFLFTREPWIRYRSYCNIYRIEVASNQSGTDNGQSGGVRDTYFSTGFNTPLIEQLNTLAGTGSSRAYSLLNAHVPEYDIPIILINDPKYGGSGGPLALTTTDPTSAGILEHELGHSFAKLTDEYDVEYDGYPNIEYPNATAKTVRSQIRWNVWIEPATPMFTPEDDPLYEDKVGHFEGANYHTAGWFRPHDGALMRFLNRPPGSVTREAIVLTYYTKISPIDAYAPTTLTRTFTAPAALSFGVTPKVPSTAPALAVEWRLNNVIIAGETGTTLSRNSKIFGNGTHKIKATVRDPTDWVRRDPTALVSEEVTWTLKLSNQTDPSTIGTALPATRVLPLGFLLALDATATGPGPITYQWLKNNVPLKPAVTTATLNVGPVTLADAGTYSVKITNPGHTISHSTALSVIQVNVPRVVVGKGRTATLPITAFGNLPPVTWVFNSQTLSNVGRYTGATTKSLQIKIADVGDSGFYSFSSGNYSGGSAELLVVTGPPNYPFAPPLSTGSVGAAYLQPFPSPADPLQTPNSYSASKLPAGLKIDPKSGLIKGIPTVASTDQTNGDEVTFTVGNEFDKVTVKIRLLIRPLPPGIAGIFSGPIYVNSALGGTLGGRIDLNILSTGAYSGSAIVGVEPFRLNGVLSVANPGDSSAAGTFTVKPKHAPAAITVPFIVNNASDADPTTANATDSQNFSAWRNRWVAPEVLDPFKGYFTFALAPSSLAGMPRGHGFGSVTIDATGKTTALGRLADGESFTTTSHLDPNGSAFIYQSLYTTPDKGRFIAILDLDPGIAAPPFFSSNSICNWLRPADTRATARTYAGGFSIPSLTIFGGLYPAPARTEIIMDLPAASGTPLKNALLTFDYTVGTDFQAVVADVSLEIKPVSITKVNTPNLKLVTFSATPTDGRFKGSYTTKDNDPRPPVPPAVSRPQITRKVDYQGIIVNDQNTRKGYGFFLRAALPEADGSTTPTTSPRYSGTLGLQKSDP